MANRRKQSFLHGAIILAAATVIVKIIGAIFKIPLLNLIGEDGMGYFNTAYTIFNPIYTLSIAGFPIAIAKLVAERAAKKRFRDVRRIMQTSALVFFVTGIVGMLILLIGARPLTVIIKNPNAYLAVMVMAPTVFFGCIMSIYRGYYEGLRNMYPTAVSQVIEALGKLIFGYSLSYIIVKIGVGQFESTGVVFGQPAENLNAAYSVVLPYAAAGAIGGVTISTLLGMLYIYISHRIRGDGITREELRASPVPENSNIILKRLIFIAIPVCLSALMVSITSMIDLVTVMNRLGSAMNKDLDTFMGMYKDIISQNKPLVEVPNFLYGIYSGAAMTLFNIIPSITTTFGVSALPAVTSSWTAKDKAGTKRNVESVLRITSLVAFPAGFGMVALAQPIVNMLWSAKPATVALAPSLLQVLGFSAILCALSTPIYSVMQAVGKMYLPVKIMLGGGAIKLVINWILVGIPSVNIHGAPIGSLSCYVFIAAASVYNLIKITRVVPDFKSVFLKPMVAAACCGFSAWGSYYLLSKISTGKIMVLVAIGLAAVVYGVVLLLIKGISKDDLAMLPKGEKIAQILEKKGFIS